ncbi:DMT family transporter [Streptomyces sp. NPDC097595]|uniref:DMT family transporter n=1 Tax=Streptomyces sp. NPDC097595 TaxID=3366090 RepID=UPI00382E1BF5
MTVYSAAGASARHQRLGYLALAASTVGVGSALIFVRLSEVDPTATLMWRMVVAAGLVGAMSVPRGARPALRDVGRRDVGLLLVSSLVAGLDLLANQWAAMCTSVANTALLMNLSPVFILLLSGLVLRQRIPAAKAGVTVLALAGCAMVVLGDSGGSSPTDRPALGNTLALASAALYATFMLMTKHLRERVPTTLIMLSNALVIALMLAPVTALTSDPALPHSASGYLLIFAYALVSQLIGHGLMTYALGVVDAGLASMSVLLRPVVAAVLGRLMLDEGMGLVQVTGGVVILAALFCFQRLERRGASLPGAAGEAGPGPVPNAGSAGPPQATARPRR